MIKFSKKAQISFEFIIIFGLVFFILIGLIYLVYYRLSELSDLQQDITMKNLADNLINEIVLASSVNNNYLRRFDLPARLSGKKYRLSLDNSEINIQLLENNNIIDEYLVVSPVDIKGGFIEDIDLNTTSHCITKSNADGVRIARNQASLDTNASGLKKGDSFEVYLSVNCVEDAKSITATISYDPAKLEIENAGPVVASDPQYKNLNPLFNGYTVIYDYTGTDGINEATGRFTYGYLGTDCVSGSGNIAKLTFKIKNTASPGETYIKFDDTYEENIKLLDCNTDKFTKEALPDSKKDAYITIIN